MKLPRSPRAFDAALAAAVIAGGVAENLLVAGISGPRWAGALLAAAMGALLLLRRTKPLAAALALPLFAGLDAVFVADLEDLLATLFPLLMLAYAGAAYAEPRAARATLVILAGTIVVIGAFDDARLENVFFPCAVVALCWLVGRNVRTRTRLAAELHEGAARLAEQREAEAREAVAEERRRIAREMHDVVAHSISIMVIQAAGARQILPLDAGRAEQAAARIGRAGRDALTEMQLVVGALGTVAAGSPSPSLDALPALVERARHAGLDVSLRVRGTPRGLPQGAELAAYRVVQEALTNAIKHAACAPTEVVVDWREESLELRVADRGDGGAAPELEGAGHGLVGMAERVRVCGGELRAGPRAEGGFEVVACIPAESAPKACAGERSPLGEAVTT
jgi:signal transduction histidine kinase